MTVIFESEDKMQKWLSGHLQTETIGDLIVNSDEIEEFDPKDLPEKRIKESYEYCLPSLSLTKLLSENENISLKEGDILKPDFVLYAPESECIVIVELKNIPQPTRQAGTEISAYSAEIKSYIPFLAEGDVINVIISTSWPTLLKHYIFNEIFWLQKKIICLEPIIEEDEIKLKIKEIKSFVEDNVSLKIGAKHLGGYQLCMYDYGRGGMELNLEQMKTATQAMATRGNTLKSHGFAFLWKDNWKEALAPYSITIANFAPFNCLERHFHEEAFEPNKFTERIIEEIIVEYCPEGHGGSLISITEFGKKFLQKFSTAREEGFHTWDVLEKTMMNRADLISFHPWGIFQELYFDFLLNEYAKGNTSLSSTDPQVGIVMIQQIIDPKYEFVDLSYFGNGPNNDEEDSE